MWLDTSKSNLTEINNSDDTLHVKNYLSSPDTNKHQKDIDNEKTAPKLSSANLPPPSLNENGSNSNEARITARNTQNSKNQKPSNKLAFIIGDSMVKNVEYLIKGSLNRKFFVRPFSSAKTSDMSDYINPTKSTSILISMSYRLEQTTSH